MRGKRTGKIISISQNIRDQKWPRILVFFETVCLRIHPNPFLQVSISMPEITIIRG
jgi:hypothetical protein